MNPEDQIYLKPEISNISDSLVYFASLPRIATAKIKLGDSSEEKIGAILDPIITSALRHVAAEIGKKPYLGVSELYEMIYKVAVNNTLNFVGDPQNNPKITELSHLIRDRSNESKASIGLRLKDALDKEPKLTEMEMKGVALLYAVDSALISHLFPFMQEQLRDQPTITYQEATEKRKIELDPLKASRPPISSDFGGNSPASSSPRRYTYYTYIEGARRKDRGDDRSQGHDRPYGRGRD